MLYRDAATEVIAARHELLACKLGAGRIEFFQLNIPAADIPVSKFLTATSDFGISLQNVSSIPIFARPRVADEFVEVAMLYVSGSHAQRTTSVKSTVSFASNRCATAPHQPSRQIFREERSRCHYELPVVIRSIVAFRFSSGFVCPIRLKS